MPTPKQASNKPEHIITKVPDTDLGAYRVIAQSGDEGCKLATAATDNVLGVSVPGTSSDPYTAGAAYKAGRRCDIATEGEPQVMYGGTVAVGDSLKPDAQGRAIKAATGPAFGRAHWAGVAGDVGSVQIDRHTAA